mgnify:CR=1 FL=1
MIEQIDPNLTNVENARRLGVSETTIRRWKAKANRPDPSLSEVDSFFTDLPSGIITSRGRSVRLADGSWEKATWKPNAKALADTLTYDDLERAIAGFRSPSAPLVPQGRQTAILNAADLQIGKACQRGGGTPETLARCMQSFHTFAEYIRATGPSAVVLVDNGDPIENVWNTPSQLVTNDLDVPAQIRTFRRLMIEGLKLLAPLVQDFTMLSVPSNHGAARVGYKSPGGTVDADFGLEISHQLEDVCAEAPGLSHVQFVRPEALDETATIERSNTKLAFHHGHQSSGPQAHGKWWAAQDHGRMAGWDADILVTAHYHSLRLEQSGDGRWIIGASSSDAQSDWFTNRTGESARQGMTAFDVLDGQWSNLRII